MLNRHKVSEGMPTSASDINNRPTFSVVVTPGMSPSSVSVLPSDTRDGGDDLCSIVRAYLSDYADDELTPAQQRDVESHLSNCPECAEILNAMFQTDEVLLREWRDDSSLPSSLQKNRAIDSIMDALPPVPQAESQFASKRIHARARWMRFSTGIAGFTVLFAILYSSYRLGYEHGLRHPRSDVPTSSLLQSREMIP